MVEFGALRVRKGKWVDGRVGSGNGEVVDVNGCEDVVDGFEASQQDREESVNGEDAQWAALEKGI